MEEELEREEYPDSLTDPLSKIILKNFIIETLKNFAKQENSPFLRYVTALNKEDQERLKVILR